jgi:CheY-like chemotaxis protein
MVSASHGPEGGAGMTQATRPLVPKIPKVIPGASERRILIVEDDAFTVAALRSILELMLGQQDVWIARDGHEGIRLAYEHPPDLILMDLALPKLDGWEVTRSLRSNPRFKRTPILAVSAHAMVGDREKALAAGCDDYFPKPIEVDEFVRFMRPYLEVR